MWVWIACPRLVSLPEFPHRSKPCSLATFNLCLPHWSDLDLVLGKFAIKLMSQYDLAAGASEITRSPPVTEMTCSISSASQHASRTRKHLFAPNDIKKPSRLPLRRLFPLHACALFIAPSPHSPKTFPRSLVSFIFPLGRKEGVNSGEGVVSETAARSCCEFHGWMCVGVK